MEELKNKRLLVLGGSTWKDLIKSFSKENGIYLVAAAPYKVDIFDIADEHHILDLMNPELMKKFIREYKIDGVYMGSYEPVIGVACQYINELGLPCYCNKEQWNILQNKKKFKLLCDKYGLPVVPEYDIDDRDIQYPVIVKPVDSSGSKGITLCHCREELEKGYASALGFSPSKHAIIEKCVDNNGLGPFYMIVNGKLVYLACEDNYSVESKEASFTKSLYICNSYHANDFRNRYEANIAKMLNDLNITNGCIWFEVFRDGNDFYFNECGFRHAGHQSMYPVYYSSGVNQVGSEIYFALTGKGKVIKSPELFISQEGRYGVYPIHLKYGTIQSIEGMDEIYKKPQVVHVFEQGKVGKTIDNPHGFSGIYAFIHFVYKDAEECKRIINEIRTTVKVFDTNGDDMVQNLLDLEGPKIEF